MNNNELIKAKIFAFNSEESVIALKRQIAFWRFKDQKIVFTNGCFDLVHPGHIDYLSKSADLGDKLIIGLNSDSSVKMLKGELRPYISQENRAMLIAALKFVDAVIVFEEKTPLELIKTVKPDVLIKGSDYEVKEIAGSDFVIENGGKVLTIEFLPGFSTTLLIKKINDTSRA